MAKKKVKAEAVPFDVPQSAEECAEYIARIGIAQRERQLIETAMNDDLAERRRLFEAQARPHAERIQALSRGVQVWCEANRARITQDGKVKFHRFSTGEVKWRLRPASIVVRGVDAVINYLREKGLERFVREKPEVDKEAMLKETDVAKTVPGISVSQKEDFCVEPFETKLEEVV